MNNQSTTSMTADSVMNNANLFGFYSAILTTVVTVVTFGIAILTQYNPHGIFIALEEIGYLIMSASFLFIAPVFSGTDRLERAIRWIFIISFILTMLSLIIFSIVYGINREYRFEVVVISIDWITLIVSGMLLSVLFKRAMGKSSLTTSYWISRNQGL